MTIVQRGLKWSGEYCDQYSEARNGQEDILTYIHRKAKNGQENIVTDSHRRPKMASGTVKMVELKMSFVERKIALGDIQKK